MRTNIDIDDELMARAMQAGPYKTKKDAVEAGLKLLARQAAYREILKWEGRLRWEGDESIDWTEPAAAGGTAPVAGTTATAVAEPAAPTYPPARAGQAAKGAGRGRR
jgi:Arc/MetJ family transcription regulator